MNAVKARSFEGVRVVCLVGIFDCWGIQEMLWRNMEMQLQEQFPGCEVAVMRELFKPWEIKVVQAYAADVVKHYDDGKPTILLGYSLGGVVAQAMAEKFKKSEILAVVSLCSPLKWADKWGFQWKPETLPGKRLAIMGTLDMLVPWWSADVPNMKVHKMMVDHLEGFRWFPHVSEKVVGVIREEFFS